ncbi:MAG: Fic family protein [archaeon]
MPTKLDVFLVIAIDGKLTIKEVIQKLPSIKYLSVYNHIKQLKKEGFINNVNNIYSVNNTNKSKELFSLIYFCFKNNLDYNLLVNEKVANYILSGYNQEYIDPNQFDNKTVTKYNSHLSKAGIIYIESKKPLKTRLIPSYFTDLLIKHFLNKSKNSKFNFETINIDNKIEKAFSKFKIKHKPILSDEIKFVYTSLSLEGITLTLPQTEKLLKENISPNVPLFKDIQQTTDYKKAISYLIENDLTLENILRFHSIAMNSLSYGAGEIRKQNVKIKGNPDFKTPDYKELSSLLAKFNLSLIKIINTKQKPSKIIEDASYLHNEFQRIHPFIDGNSRTSRAIFSVFLTKLGFPLINIPAGYFDIYMKQTKLSKTRNDKEFSILMKLIVLKNLEERE